LKKEEGKEERLPRITASCIAVLLYNATVLKDNLILRIIIDRRRKKKKKKRRRNCPEELPGILPVVLKSIIIPIILPACRITYCLNTY
jgi:hypothetical protein